MNTLYSVNNITRSADLANRARVAGTSAERRKGLLRCAQMGPGEALLIAPCEAVHTLGMKWPIDVVFLDKGYRVCKIVSEMPPWRVTFCCSAAAVLELPAGVLRPEVIQVGDTLTFRPSER